MKTSFRSIYLSVFLLPFTVSFLNSQSTQGKSFFDIPSQFFNEGMIFGEKLRIINLGPEVNSDHLDYAPTVSLDGKTIYFVSDRKGGSLKDLLPGIDSYNSIDDNSMPVFYTNSNELDISYCGDINIFSFRTSDNDQYIIIQDESKDRITKRMLPKRLELRTSYDSNFNKYIHTRKRGKDPIELGFPDQTQYFKAIDTLKNETTFIVFYPFGKKFEEFDFHLSHDFWAVEKVNRLDTTFLKPYNLDKGKKKSESINTFLNEGCGSISGDNKWLYFTGCDRSDGYGDCDIYRVSLEDNNWGKLENLGKNVNSKYFDSQQTISPDQSRVYFVSTRPGPNSEGKPASESMDIWYSDWDYVEKKWLPAENLVGVNTPGHDCSPFICADRRTLFFSSTGHSPNYGKLDFYVTRYDPVSKIWSIPINLGEKLNTSEDEMFLTMPAYGDVLYFSSKRTDISGYQGSLDLYMGYLPNVESLIVINKNLLSASPNPFSMSTNIQYSLENDSKVNISIYDVNGSRIITLVDESKIKGKYYVDWDGRNKSGEKAANGVYFYRITITGSDKDYIETKELIFTK